MHQRRRQHVPQSAAAPVASAFVAQISQSRHGRLWLLGGTATLLGAWFLTPVGDWAAAAVVATIPLEEDVALGRRAVAEARYVYASDDYGLPSLGRSLVDRDRELARSGIPFSFRVVRQPGVVNAFAYPGGAILVTEELVQRLRATPSELAAVLGHEIGHVVRRHAQQRIVKRRLVPFLCSVLFYDDGDDRRETFGEATGELLLQFAGQLGELAFSRANEYEADDVSWRALQHAGYDPRSLNSFFRKLLALHGGGGGDGGRVGAMLSTHPATEERMRVLEQRWEQLPSGERDRIERGAPR